MKKNEIHKISFLVSFWLLCGIFIAVYDASLLGFRSAVGGTEYNFTVILFTMIVVVFIAGSFLAYTEVIYLSRLLKKKPFGAALLIKTGVYLLVMIIFISIALIFIYSSETGKPVLSSKVLNLYFDSLTNSRIILLIVYWGIACIIALFILQVNEKFGHGVLVNLLLGRYHQPREEERIFMFLDLTSSTAMAEQLGPKRYSAFLKDYFFDMDEIIYKTKGAVFQFVGDEVVIIWDIEKGTENNNCIKFFFLWKEKIQSTREKYLKKYNACPDFKAGLHFGKVIVTEIGGTKKEIAYHGDAINTASRIRSECHTFNKNLLISAELLSHLSELDNEFMVDSMGVIQLKGKKNVTGLFSVEEKN